VFFVANALQLAAPRTRQDWQLTLRQRFTKGIGLRPEKDLLKTVVIQRPKNPRTVILTVAGNRHIAIDRDIVFRLALQRLADNTLPAAYCVAGRSVKISGFNFFGLLSCLRPIHRVGEIILQTTRIFAPIY
jgi:hypothetical protein